MDTVHAKKRRLRTSYQTICLFSLVIMVLGVVLTLSINSSVIISEAIAQITPPPPGTTKPPGISDKSGSEAGKDGQDAEKGKQKTDKDADKGEKTGEKLKHDTEYSWQSVGLVTLLILFLLYIFRLLMLWSQKMERASYMGRLYKDSIETIELQRLAYYPNKKLEKGDYIREIARDEAWMEKHHPPDIPPEIKDEIEEDPFAILILRGGYSGKVPSTRSTGLYPTGPPADEATISDEVRARREKDKLRHEYNENKDKWDREVLNEVERRFQEDMEKQHDKARNKAEDAVDIDLTVLRGRTPAFILEFTAVVVIIFAAVILGILDILKEQQIGTLLAAIAGYVLGRATSRSASEASQPQKTIDETNKAAGKTGGK